MPFGHNSYFDKSINNSITKWVWKYLLLINRWCIAKSYLLKSGLRSSSKSKWSPFTIHTWLRNRWSKLILTILLNLVKVLCFSCPQRLFNYFAIQSFDFECIWWRLLQFQSFNFECTWSWWRLFQKRVVHTKLDDLIDHFDDIFCCSVSLFILTIVCFEF